MKRNMSASKYFKFNKELAARIENRLKRIYGKDHPKVKQFTQAIRKEQRVSIMGHLPSV